jgi:hypothetical protein
MINGDTCIINQGQTGTGSGGGSTIGFVKKGKQFLSWFFLRSHKKKHLSHQTCENPGGCGTSTTNGIYKTKSCTELKLRNCNGNTASKRAGDVNQNL